MACPRPVLRLLGAVNLMVVGKSTLFIVLQTRLPSEALNSGYGVELLCSLEGAAKDSLHGGR